MRISTTGFTQGHLESLGRLQAGVQRTQAQVAAGTRLLAPADDPVAAARVQEFDRWMLAAEQYDRNGELLSSRLGLQEGALAEVSDILMRVRELAVQGGNGALDASARRMLATEVRSNLDQLLQIGNRRAPSGEHLFSGGNSAAPAFLRQGGAVQYAGDDLQRWVEIAPGQRIADGLPGSELFMRIPAGNGSFALRADPANAGTAVAGAGAVLDPAVWDGEPYRILFMANGDWEARDAADGLVASAPYVAGDSIEFKGIRIAVSGSPIAGDQIHIDPAGTEDMFATLERLANALEGPLGSSAQRAASTNQLNAVLAQLAQGQEQLSVSRATIAARMNAVDNAAVSRNALREDVTTSLSQLRDLDYAEALTRLNAQLTGLQAAQQSVARLARLSLFDYL